MLKKWQYQLLTAMGALALVLVILNGTLFTINRNAQAAINTRQQFIQQTVQLEGLYREIVKGLAELGVKNSDTQIIQMLAALGINVSANPPAAVAAPGAQEMSSAHSTKCCESRFSSSSAAGESDGR